MRKLLFTLILAHKVGRAIEQEKKFWKWWLIIMAIAFGIIIGHAIFYPDTPVYGDDYWKNRDLNGAEIKQNK